MVHVNVDCFVIFVFIVSVAPRDTPLPPHSFPTVRFSVPPVGQGSGFAASAYCEEQGGRLPTWSEWEYAAAADETRHDARKDPVWRERILNWYSQPSNHALPRAGLQTPNAWGVQDLHGLV